MTMLLNGYPSTLWWFKGLLVGREAPPRSRHTARLNTSYRYVTINLAWSGVVLCKAQPVSSRKRAHTWTTLLRPDNEHTPQHDPGPSRIASNVMILSV